MLTTLCNLQVEKSQGEIYRLRAKLESTQTENENMHDELDKMQQALNRSYTDRDKIATDIEKLRDDLERSQVYFKVFCNFNVNENTYDEYDIFGIKQLSHIFLNSPHQVNTSYKQKKRSNP